MTTKRIGIIGAGISGIAAVKACREQGFDCIVFERTDKICGLWNYREEELEGNASIMRTLVCNTSKEMTAFSDTPPPKDFPNFMHNTKMAEYLELCANSIGFENYVKFKHEVITCEPNNDYEETGKWKLTVNDLNSGTVIVEVFDGVMVCSGLNNKPVLPTFKDQHKFKGKLIHSRSYRKPNEYQNKTVVVVGIGNSAGDIAVELSTVAKKVYLSTRTGSWIINRVGLNGMPFDGQFSKRSMNTLISLTPYPLLCYFGEIYINSKFNHKLYDLKPKHRLFGQHPMINDDLPNRILSGYICVKQNIDRFTENGVFFEDEKEETVCDVVVFATGYQLSYPFLSESLIKFSKSDFNLYKHVFYPNIKHPKTLAVISCIQPKGAIPPIAELQCRWFTLLMANKLKLPDQKQMLKSIAKKKEWIKKRFFDEERHSIEEEWIPYMDDLANIIGVKPNLLKYFFTDPKLWWNLYFGPCLPYQYRLKGENSYPSTSRQLIISVAERIKAPLMTRNH